MSDLKRIGRDPVRFDLFGAFVSAMGSKSIRKTKAVDDFLSRARDSISKSLMDEKFLHGQRVQNMFENVVVALGHIRLIKTEDSGGGWFDADGLAVPDFRVILQDGEQFLVEVKNHHKHPLKKPYTMTRTYFARLERYGKWVGTPVRLAVYWSMMNLWSVVPLEALQERGDKYVLPLIDAAKANTMASFGDLMIGTRPPLTLRLTADTKKPRSVEGGRASFTIAEVKIFCAGGEIVKRHERNIALALLMYGNWNEKQPSLEVDERGLPFCVTYESAPDEDSGQGFEMIGELSGMYSRRFALSTLEQGRVARIAAEVRPGVWGSLIPSDYKGEALPLWIFRVQPS
jgi:hypothetical protein